MPHPAFPVPVVPAVEVDGDPLFGTFGNVNSSKRVPQLLEAFARVRHERSGAGLLLVGAISPGFDLDRRLQRLGLDGGGLVREGYVDETRLWGLMQACDVHVNLRSPTMGETSGTAIRALALGKPLVVSDVGWFAELPDDVALKVPVDDDEVDTLVAALELLASRPDVRAAMGAAALELARREHDLDHVADLYVAAFEHAAGGGAVSDAVLGDVSTAAAAGRDRARLRRGERRSRLASPRSSSVVDRLRAVPGWAWLAAIVVLSFAVRAWLARGMLGPFIMVDELIYSELAKSFASDLRFAVRDVPMRGYGVVYPILISPAYAIFDRMPDVYATVKAINSLVMSLAAVPTYLIARRVVGKWSALLAALLAVAVPSMVYTATVMTENAYYPIFLLAALALVALLERPSLLNHVLFFATLGLAYLTRSQAIVVAAAAVTAPILFALFQRDGFKTALWPFRWLYATFLVGAVLVVLAQTARGMPLSSLLGSYAVIASGGNYDVGKAAHFVVYHAAELDLYLGVIPVAAAIVLTARARTLDRALQVLLAATIALAVWTLVVVGTFASRFADRIQERNTFAVAPLFLILLLAWVERGAPRPRIVASAAAAAAALLILAIPFDRFVTTSAVSDTLMLLPWWAIQLHWHITWLMWLAFIGAVVLAAVFLFLPRRVALALPLIVLAYWLVASKPIWYGPYPYGVKQAGAGALFQGIRGARRDWIDRAVPKGAAVAAL